MAVKTYYIANGSFTTKGTKAPEGVNTALNLKQYILDVNSDTTGLGSSVALADGTVALPSLFFDSDIDSGFYLSANGVIGIAITGVADFTISANTFTALSGSSIATNTIVETTAASGVTIDGALIKDGSFTGKQATATATADGLTTGLLSGTDQFVTVTSASANNIICLPSDTLCPIGTTIRGWVGANGCELRSLAADTTQTINNVTGGVTNEAAIPATTLFKVQKVASLTWILTAVDEAGAVITAIIPDAV